MKTTIKLFTFYLFFILSFSGLKANEVQDFANIFGKIVTSEDYFVAGASIGIKSINNFTSSDFTGNFVLNNLKEGVYILSISYLGLKDIEMEVIIEKNKNLDLGKIVMYDDNISLSEVTITASIEGQQKAYNQQKNAENIKSVVSADLIGRFPDLNVAESLQRVSGVSISRNNGEGSNVQIRGTPLNFTTININGEQIPASNEGGGRSESLDLISADQLASMEIFKSNLPEMDGDAIGGSINLITPTAKSAKLKVKGSAGGGYNNLFEEGSGIFKLGLEQRFLDGKLGVLMSGSYYRTVNGEERVETIYGLSDFGSGLEINDFGLRPLLNTRERKSFTATIDYNLSSSSKIYLNTFYNNVNDNSLRNRLRFRPRAGSYINETTASGTGVEIRRDINDRVIDRENITFNLGGKHLLNNSGLNLDYEAFYTSTERKLTSDRHTFRKRDLTLIVDRSNVDFPTFSSPDFDFEDYAAFGFTSFERDNPIKNKGSNLVGKFNITQPIKIKDNFGELKFGAKLRALENKRRRNTQVFDQLDGVYNLSQVLGSNSIDMFGGIYSTGFVPNAKTSLKFFNENFSNFTSNEGQSQGLADSNFYDANEDVFATYIQGKIQFGKLIIIGGFRYENTSVTYDALRVNRTPAGIWESSEPVSGSNKYDFLLPMINLRYKLNENQNLRFAATRTYARPNFTELIPNEDVNVFELRIVSGNPDLKPASSTNIDLLYENFFKKEGVLSGGIFYKRITDFIFTQQSIVTSGEFEGFRITTPVNGDVASIKGAEINFSKKFTFLPGFLSNFGTFLNYTYIHSESDVADRKNVRFPGQADHIWNAALYFDKGGFSIRGSLNFNGGFLTSVSSDPRFDFFTDDRYQLDVNASYEINKNLTLFTEFVNLTDARRIEYQLDRSHPFNIEGYGWSARFGMNFKF